MTSDNLYQTLPGPVEPTPEVVVRKEYAIMTRQLAGFAQGFGFQLDEVQYRDISLFTIAMEKLDYAFDECPLPEYRHLLSAQVCSALRGTPGQLTGEPDFVWIVSKLCEMVERRGLQIEYERLAREIFDCGERKRGCNCRTEFLRIVSRESELMVEFMLRILGDYPPEFRVFALRLATSANLLDDVLDMRRDFRDGAQVLEPSFTFCGRALLNSVTNAWEAFKVFPNKLELLRLNLSFLPWIARSFASWLGDRSDKVRVVWLFLEDDQSVQEPVPAPATSRG